jgi:hypothetical protein
MFIAVLVMQLVYAMLVDDWSFGLKDRRIINMIAYSGIAMLAAQHIYRIATIVTIVRKARFAVANAKAYLIASFAVMVVLVTSSMVSFTGSSTKLQTHALGIQLQNVGQAFIILAVTLGMMLPWWLILAKSKKVKMFETMVRT